MTTITTTNTIYEGWTVKGKLTCQCKWCSFTREYNDRLDALPIEHQEFFQGVLDRLLETEYDLDYWKAKAKGEI